MAPSPQGITQTQKQAAATKIVNDFAARPTRPPPPFLYMSRDQVAAGALKRIANPTLINQGQAGLCGPAAFLEIVATTDPESYAQAIVDLFEKGSARIGHGGKSYKLEPGADLRHYQLPTTAKIDQADWIILASLRDSDFLHNFIEFASYDNDVAAGTMVGRLAKWFRETGYQDVRDATNIMSSADLPNANEANNLLNKGFNVVLSINDNMLYSDLQDKGSGANHFVVLLTPIQVVTGNVSFTVFTWGEQRSIPSNKTSQDVLVKPLPLSTSSFLKNYYGYVAGKF
jgi:hypothetical protein